MKRLTLLVAPALCWAGLTLSACGHENEIFVQEGTRVGNPAPKPPVEPVPVDTYEGEDATFVGNPGNVTGPVVGLPDNDLPIGIPPTDAPPSTNDGGPADMQYPVVPTAEGDSEDAVPVIEMPEVDVRPDSLHVEEIKLTDDEGSDGPVDGADKDADQETEPLTLREFAAEYPLWEGEIAEKDLVCRFYTVEVYEFFSAVEIRFFEDEARENLCSSTVAPYKFINDRLMIANFEAGTLVARLDDNKLDIDFVPSFPPRVNLSGGNPDKGKSWNFQK